MHLQKLFTLVLLLKMLDPAGKVHHPHQPDLEVYTIVVEVVEQQGVQQGGPFVPRVAVEVVLKEPFVVQEVVPRVDLPVRLQA
jgi:hypothetical protein